MARSKLEMQTRRNLLKIIVKILENDKSYSIGYYAGCQDLIRFFRRCTESSLLLNRFLNLIEIEKDE